MDSVASAMLAVAHQQKMQVEKRRIQGRSFSIRFSVTGAQFFEINSELSGD
jgi:hypothetical protein